MTAAITTMMARLWPCANDDGRGGAASAGPSWWKQEGTWPGVSTVCKPPTLKLRLVCVNAPSTQLNGRQQNTGMRNPDTSGCVLIAMPFLTVGPTDQICHQAPHHARFISAEAGLTMRPLPFASGSRCLPRPSGQAQTGPARLQCAPARVRTSCLDKLFGLVDKLFGQAVWTRSLWVPRKQTRLLNCCLLA